MNIKYYELLIEKSEKEINYLKSLLLQFKENKRNISEKEYNYETNRINYYLEKELTKLQENQLIIKSYKIIINELKLINQLKKYKINDKYDKEQYDYELTKRNEIIMHYKDNLPIDLYNSIEKEILETTISNIEEQENKITEDNNNITRSVIELPSSSNELSNDLEEESKDREEIIERNYDYEEIKTTSETNNNTILLPASHNELPNDLEEESKDKEEIIERNYEEIKTNSETNDNIILLPASSNELTSKTEDSKSEIKIGIKYDYTLEEVTDSKNDSDKKDKESNSENSNESNNNNKKEETNKINQDNNENNNDDKNNTNAKTDENNKKELKIKEIHNATPTLKAKVIEKVKKYGIQALVIISTGAILSLAINPTAAFYIVGFGSIIGLNIKSRINEKVNKKARKKGKYLKR